METYDVPGRDPDALAAAVQRWIHDHLKYVREAPETIASPGRTLAWGLGDCDDFTVLAASALRSARIPSRAVFVGWTPDPHVPLSAVPYRHVYPQYATRDGTWKTIETVKRVPPGWDVAKEQAKKGFRVVVGAIGDPRDRVVGS